MFTVCLIFHQAEVTSASGTPPTTQKDSSSYIREIKMLLVDVIATKKRAESTGSNKVVRVLNAMIKGLVRLLPLVKTSQFDRGKVDHSLQVRERHGK